MIRPIILSAVGDLISSLLDNQAVIVAIFTVAATVLLRSGIKIYNMGRMSKAELITRKEFIQFEANMRADMKAYRDEIFNSVWKLCKTYLDQQLKDLDKISKLANETEKMTIEYKADLKHTKEDLNEVRPLIKEMKRLEKKLFNLEFGENVRKTERRTDDD